MLFGQQVSDHCFHLALLQRTSRANQEVEKETEDRQNGDEENAEELVQERIGAQQNVARCEEDEEDEDEPEAEQHCLDQPHRRIIREEEEPLVEERGHDGEL